jgi:predicted dehydrogenase
MFGTWDHTTFTVEDYASAFVRLEGGATLILEAAFCMNNEDGMNFWIMGDKGGAKMSPCTIYREEFGTLTDSTPGWLPGVAEHAREIEDFVKAIRGEGVVGVTGEQGLMVTQILDAIYESSDEGKEVAVADIGL